jgi:hypothetical protein
LRRASTRHNSSEWENEVRQQILPEYRVRISKKQVLRLLAKRRWLDTWKKIVVGDKDF